MEPFVNTLTNLIGEAFKKCKYPPIYGKVVVSKTEFCQYQCNGALAIAKQYKRDPFPIANDIVANLPNNEIIRDISVVPPGFININIDDEYIVDFCSKMLYDSRLGLEPAYPSLTIIIDYGGANIAKPLHVGHLRSAIIGESLKRIARSLGHKVISDVHLGDWGLQMGMIIAFLKEKHPDLIFFSSDFKPDKITESPVSIRELEYIYPQASSLAKSDAKFMMQARKATYELQSGNPGYLALWKHVVELSTDDLKASYDRLNVSFDIWEGESDSRRYIKPMIEVLKQKKYAFESQGALVVDISESTDNAELPPLILEKSDGAILYSTTELATIQHRVNTYNPSIVLYVVDKRQEVHFIQVFRAAYKSGIAPKNLKLEHIPFGTMNGKDGKPFKTRDGGAMKLNDLIQTLVDEANKRMISVTDSSIISDQEREKVAELVGGAALKFGDLINVRTSDYIFDIDKFSAFEGKTGPYLLYSIVRINSILRKANEMNYSWNRITIIESDIERNLLLKLMELPDILNKAFDNRYPSIIAEYIYSLSSLYNTFYHTHHIIKEKDKYKRSSRLAILSLTQKLMEFCLSLLGIMIPERL